VVQPSRPWLAWPDETVLYGAHEYTAANARFALSIDDRPEMRGPCRDDLRHARARRAHRADDAFGAEKAFNPFLRATDAADFGARRRAAKDSFQG
jgi:hydroxyacylglutathione hydrolase